MENLNLFTSVESSPKDSSKNSNKTSSDTKKEGTSLFDTLLKESTVSLENKEITSENENLNKQENKNNQNLKAQVNTQVNTQTQNPETKATETQESLSQNSTKTEVKNNSLSNNNLNKIVVDTITAKTSIKTIKNDAKLDVNLSNSTNSSNSSNSNVSTSNITNTTNIETNAKQNSVKIYTKTDLSIDTTSSLKASSAQKPSGSIIVDAQNNITVSTQTKQNIENTTEILSKSDDANTKGLSLMDKLLVDAKQQINAQSKVVTNTQISENSGNIESIENTKSIVNTLNTKSNENNNSLNTKTIEVSVNSKNAQSALAENSNPETITTIKNPKDTLNKNEELTAKVVVQKPINTDKDIKVDEKLENSSKEQITSSNIKFEDDIKTVLTSNYDSLKSQEVLDQEKANEVKISIGIDVDTNINTKTDAKLDTKVSDESNTQEKTQNNLEAKQSINITSDSTLETKLNTSNIKEETVSKKLDGLTADAIVKDDTKVKSSLLDDLIKKATAEIENSNKPEIKPEVKTENLNNLNVLNKDTQVPKSEVLGNMFLGSQKNNATNQGIISSSIARTILSNATNVDDVKKAADILNLNTQELQLKVENNQLLKDLDLNKLDSKISILDKLMSNIQRVNDISILSAKFTDMINTNSATSSMNSALATASSDFINEANDVTINVNQTLANNIQTRIIGARQQMSSMMSDLARTMYENYKPPVTTFKINLNPANLGMISVVMRNERDNSISISMNMSSNETLEAMLDNQNSLRGALFKAFGNEDTAFNLDFGSNSNSSNQNDNDFASNQNDNIEDNSNNTSATNTKQEDNLTYL